MGSNEERTFSGGCGVGGPEFPAACYCWQAYFGRIQYLVEPHGIKTMTGKVFQRFAIFFPQIYSHFLEGSDGSDPKMICRLLNYWFLEVVVLVTLFGNLHSLSGSNLRRSSNGGSISILLAQKGWEKGESPLKKHTSFLGWAFSVWLCYGLWT